MLNKIYIKKRQNYLCNFFSILFYFKLFICSHETAAVSQKDIPNIIEFVTN